MSKEIIVTNVTTISVKGLALGDTVRRASVQAAEGAWSDCFVTQIKDDKVTLLRIYVTCPDFIYSGGVIPYMGHEYITLFRENDTSRWLLLDRKTNLR